MRGIPARVTQDELNSKKEPIETRGTPNKAVTEGDPKRTNLIEAIMYDTTPVHYVSTVSEDLKWVVKKKECFNVETGEVKALIFLCMN